MKQALADVFVPSRLFIYYNERVIEGTVDEDAGAMIRDGIKSVAKQGAPHESLWPYVIAKFRHEAVPPAYRDARLHQALLYQRVAHDAPSAAAAASPAGFPFVFGFTVYESFESADGGQDRAACRCRSRPSVCSAATPCWRWATTSTARRSSCAIHGGRRGAWRVLHDAVRLPARSRT